MSLKSVPIQFEVVQCDFCGTVHTSAAEAKMHGCISENPEPAYKVGDRVYADFIIGAGIEAVGSAMAFGVVSEVLKPTKLQASWSGPSTKVLREATYPSMPMSSIARSSIRTDQKLHFFCPYGNHEWHYRVTPITNANDRGELLAGVYTESLLKMYASHQ